MDVGRWTFTDCTRAADADRAARSCADLLDQPPTGQFDPSGSIFFWTGRIRRHLEPDAPSVLIFLQVEMCGSGSSICGVRDAAMSRLAGGCRDDRDDGERLTDLAEVVRAVSDNPHRATDRLVVPVPMRGNDRFQILVG
jgi:hypothetical protein